MRTTANGNRMCDVDGCPESLDTLAMSINGARLGELCEAHALAWGTSSFAREALVATARVSLLDFHARDAAASPFFALFLAAAAPQPVSSLMPESDAAERCRTAPPPADRPARTTTDGQPPRPGFEDASAPAPTGPDGQHEAYWILSGEERAKGFVRPLRTSYRHVGAPGPRYELRDLDADERGRYGAEYVKYEPYPESERPLVGRGWTQADLDRIGKGCGTVTTMGRALAETYARDPAFYGSTFCCGCRAHLPVGAAGEFVWDGTDERVGT